jgi:DNA mismatch endonuclease (patch repair protein)
MVDIMLKEKRSRVMQSIHSQSKLENSVSKAIWKRGYRFRKNVKSLYGKPDIAIKKFKIAIFIDSCFWHVCPRHGHIPKSNEKYWIPKLNKNEAHDEEVNEYYIRKEWHVKRIWEHELREGFDGAVDSICSFIDRYKDGK